jgi:hypothetical protein
LSRLFRRLAGRSGLVLVVASVMSTGGALAQAPPVPAPAQNVSPQGVFRSGDTTIRVTITRTEARGVFAEVGQSARNLGFKPADVSFVASVAGSLMHGEHTIRYGRPNCHPNGRKVPMMGRLTPNGQVLAVHFYMLQTDQNCRDTGQYEVSQTLWQRVAER